MKNPAKIGRWSPYVVGVGIGALSWITFGLMDKALGVSTSFVGTAGAIESLVAADHVQDNAYFAKYLVGSPLINWQFALVIALAIGAFVAGWLGRSRQSRAVPEVWEARFGSSKAKRFAFAFLGGAILLFGARMAGGCTSGHGISGGLQLAVSSWVFLIAMFASGVAAAMLIYRTGKGASHV